MIAVTQTLLPIGVHAPIFQTRPCAQRKGSSCPTLLREPLGFPVKLLNSRFSVKFYVDSSLSWAVWPAVWKQPWGKERLLETIFVYLFGCTGCWLWLTGPFLASRGLLVDTCGIKIPDQRSNRKWNESHSVVSDSCDPMDCSLPGSSVHGILQARILERVAISFSRGSSPPRNQTRGTAGRFFTHWAMREAHSFPGTGAPCIRRTES